MNNVKLLQNCNDAITLEVFKRINARKRNQRDRENFKQT